MNMTDRIIIGQRIAELRKNKGLTQAELADRIGVSHQAVSQWERSETLPDILTLPALAEIFGESVSAIMGMEDVKAKDNAENVISDEDKDEEAAETTDEDKDSGGPEITAEYTERSAEDDSGNVNIDGDGAKLDLTKDEYEVVVMKNGERVTSFIGNPDKFMTVVIKGDVYSLDSNLGVTVEGNVHGNATSGFGMTISGCVGGDVKSGFETKCGDVAGNVKAGFNVNCGQVGGEASGAFGVNGENAIKKGMEDFRKSVSDAACSINGATKGIREVIKNAMSGDKTIHIFNDNDADVHISGESKIVEGDVHEDLDGYNTVIVRGNLYGDISSCQNVKVEGDVSGDVEADTVTVNGGANGDIDAGRDVHVGGDASGDIDAGGSVTVDGECGGDIDAGGSVEIGGECGGEVDAGGSVTINGDCNGDVDAGGNVTINGDNFGDIDAGNKVTVSGNSEGDIDAGGNVEIGGDASGDIDANNVTVHGDASYDKYEDEDDNEDEDDDEADED